MEKNKQNKIIALIFLLFLITVSAVFGYDWFFNTDEGFSGGSFLNTQASENALVLTSHTETLNYMWIANSGESSISKVDTVNNKELARYWTCSGGGTGDCWPSRTSVDPEGNVWVGNRKGSFEVVKIAGNPDYCVDRNHNGVIETSYDANNNSRISTDEMKPWGQDECVILHVNHWPDMVPPSLVGPRALAIDLNGYVWVGVYDGKRFVKLRPNDGSLVTEVSLASIGVSNTPYGAAIDESGSLWSVSTGVSGYSSLISINTSANSVTGAYTFPGMGLYGTAVDKHNRVWLSTFTGGALLQVNTQNPLQYRVHSTTTGGRGVTVDNEGNVWVAYSSTWLVTKYIVSGATYPAVVTPGCSANIGGGPIGVVVDKNNYVWVVSYDGYASKINPSSCSVVAQVPVGLFPYSYSDLTGSLLYQFIKEGSWTITLQNTNGFNNFWKNVSWVESNNDGNNVVVKRRVLSDPDFVQIVNGERFDIASPSLVLQVTLKRNSDGSSPKLESLHVEASCVATENLEATCNDGLDNDCDGSFDCDDSDCTSEEVCTNCNPDCIPTVCHPHSEVCTNGYDDNCNGLVDCEDPTCSTDDICMDCDTACSRDICNTRYESCDNFLDDNCNGLTDCDDPDCSSQEVCHNCDPTCPTAVCKPGLEMCNDNLDNDCDNLVDCFDSDNCCANPLCFGNPSCCALTNARWDVVDNCPTNVEVIANNTFVKLIASGNSVCEGKELRFRIFSDSNDDVSPFPPKAKFSDNKVISNWTVIWNGDPDFGFVVDGVGIPPVSSINKVKVCAVGGKPDDDCDGVSEGDLCPNTPCGADVETSGVCQGCSEEQCVCVSAVDCTNVEWSECNENNKMTRNICKDGSNDPSCCNTPDNCLCDVHLCPGHGSWILTSRDCLEEEEFGFFSSYSLVIGSALIVCYYLFVSVRKRRKLI